MRRSRLLISAIAALVVAAPFTLHVAAQTTVPQVGACDETALPPRLVIGQVGRVVSGVQINLRPQPTTAAARAAVAPPGTSFDVLNGPVCADGYTWWQVTFMAAGRSASYTGWMAEGDARTGEYWLEPRGRRVWLENRDGVPVAYIEDADGFIEREGCLRPPDSYNRLQIGLATLNARTLAMLDHAQRLYRAGGGFVDFRQAITQGSYNAGGVAASFGTHDGGGAVDISVRSPVDFSILTGEIEPMIDALRVAGFAAWLRDTNELHPGSPIHIHAIAVGDEELSQAARDQIDGERGYLRGYDGLPEEYGPPRPDRHGGPVICRWMVEMGFGDLRASQTATPMPAVTPRP